MCFHSHKVALTFSSLQLYNRELEEEFGPFDDWVNTFELYRGKANEEDGNNEERFVGKFKVRQTQIQHRRYEPIYR